MPFNWTCPYCAKPQTVTDSRVSSTTHYVGVGDVADGNIVLQKTAIACANPDCNRLTLRVSVGQDTPNIQGYAIKPGTQILSEQLMPRGSAKPQPPYIPAPLVADYTEACLIRDLSPKASATLSRRCLQGMIRDFCGISKGRLIDEIEALKTAVENGSADRAITPEGVEAIDHVRGLGNIGAHMEKDIDVIVPVDPGEAQAMLDLIELLFEEWYGSRDRRARKLSQIEKIKLEKEGVRQAAKEEKAAPQSGSGESALAQLLSSAMDQPGSQKP